MIDGSSFGTARSPIAAIIFIQIQSIDELRFRKIINPHIWVNLRLTTLFLKWYRDWPSKIGHVIAIGTRGSHGSARWMCRWRHYFPGFYWTVAPGRWTPWGVGRGQGPTLDQLSTAFSYSNCPNHAAGINENPLLHCHIVYKVSPIQNWWHFSWRIDTAVAQIRSKGTVIVLSISPRIFRQAVARSGCRPSWSYWCFRLAGYGEPLVKSWHESEKAPISMFRIS